MATELEAFFASWAQPPSQTERDKCDNAERAIREAITASAALGRRSVTAFAQGSYRNRTNVRADSDVDVCVLCTDTFFFDMPHGFHPGNFNISTPPEYPYESFRNDVADALTNHFGAAAVTPGNKAFDIHENTYRIAADAVACFEFRLYRPDGSWLSGAAFAPRSGGLIVNWPEQSYSNGVAKNDRTGRRYKAVVRILKRLRNAMRDHKIASADAVPSFLLECLVWNTPDSYFGNDGLTDDVRGTIAFLWNHTREDATCSTWFEVNGIKPLFQPNQPWNRADVNTFLLDAWIYGRFE